MKQVINLVTPCQVFRILFWIKPCDFIQQRGKTQPVLLNLGVRWLIANIYLATGNTGNM